MIERKFCLEIFHETNTKRSGACSLNVIQFFNLNNDTNIFSSFIGK
jgi:hypothetical protein